MTDHHVELDLDDSGLVTDLPRPDDARDAVQRVPFCTGEVHFYMDPEAIEILRRGADR